MIEPNLVDDKLKNEDFESEKDLGKEDEPLDESDEDEENH